jgi:O-antigen/teichoic acid export membrane protein
VAVAASKIPTVVSWHLVRQASRRITWGVADQAMSTLTNFLLSIFVARTLGASQFGAFSLAYLTYGFAINASRGLSIEPLLIRFSGMELPIWRRATAGCTGTALLVGVAAGACAFTAGVLLGGTTGLAFAALGLTLPGLLLQDSWRYAFFALGRGYHALINDSVWAAVQIPLLLWLKFSGHANVFLFVLAWGGAAGIGAVFGSLQSRVVPSLPDAMRWLSRHRDLGPRYLAENTGGNAADTLRGYGASYLLGLAAVGYIQATNVLMGPFKIIYFGLSMILIPEAALILRRSPRHLPTFSVIVTIGLTLVAMAWGAVLLVALPRGLGHLMLGGLWRPTYPLVLPATLGIMAMCATTGAGVGLHALGAARRSLRAVIITAVLVVAGSLLGAATGGTVGTMRYYAAASWLGTLVCWWQYQQALHESGTAHVPRWLLWPHAQGKHHREKRSAISR